jgi:hypothetical protein
MWTWDENAEGSLTCALDAHSEKFPKLRDQELHIVLLSAVVWPPMKVPPE